MPKPTLRCPAATPIGATAAIAAAAAIAFLAQPAAAQSTTIFDSLTGAAPQNQAPFTFDTIDTISGDSITSVLADDITPIAGYAGHSISSVTFLGYNGNGVDVTVRPIVYMWLADGAGGAPGTYLGSQTLSVVNLNGASSNATPVSATFSSGMLTVPSSTFWFGVQFDNAFGSASATAAQLSNTGLVVSNPVTTGSSADKVYETSAAGGFVGTSNPAGTVQNFGGSPVANFGFTIKASDATPEPGTLWLLASMALPLLGAGTVARRRPRRPSA